VRTELAVIVCLVAAGCGSETGETVDSSAGESAPPTPTEGQTFVTLEEVDTSPWRLVPGAQMEGTDDGGDVYTALWAKPSYGPGGGRYPRSISLNMTIGNHEGPVLKIEAHFEPRSGGVEQVAPSPFCPTGGPRMPNTLTPGMDETGCLNYLIPGEEGRLVLVGNSNFDWYVKVPKFVD